MIRLKISTLPTSLPHGFAYDAGNLWIMDSSAAKAYGFTVASGSAVTRASTLDFQFKEWYKFLVVLITIMGLFG